MANIVKRTEKEIEWVRQWAEDGEMEGSHFPGMSYEAGINAAFRWLFGETDENPTE